MRLRWRIAAAVSLGAMVWMAFGASVQSEFVNLDDSTQIYRNPLFKNFTADELIQFWSAPYAELYIPLTYTVWGGLVRLSHQWFPDTTLIGLSATLFHLLNVVLHWANSLLVFAIALRMTKSSLGAFLGAAVFALHPLQVESVAWVSGLKDLLFSSLCLGAFYCYLNWCEDRARRGSYLLSYAMWILAMFAKPSAVVLPLILVAYDVLLHRRSWRESTHLLLWFVSTIPFVLVLKSQQTETKTRLFTPFIERPKLVLDTLLFYCREILVPDSVVLHERRLETVFARPWEQLIPGIFALCGGLTLLFRTSRTAFTGWIFFLLSLVPILGITNFSYQSYSTVAHRYAYFGTFGVAVALSALMATLASQTRRASAVVIASICTFYLIVDRSLVPIWKNSYSLYGYKLQADPDSYFAHGGLAAVYGLEKKYEDALVHLKRALKIWPGEKWASYNALWTALKLEDIAQARVLLDEGVKIDSHDVDPSINLMWYFADRGQLRQTVLIARWIWAYERTKHERLLELARAWEKDADSAKAMMALAIWESSGDEKRATKLFAERFDPEHIVDRSRLRAFLIQLGVKGI